MLSNIEINDDELTEIHQTVQDVLSGKPIKLDDQGGELDVGELLKSISGGGLEGIMGNMSQLLGKAQSGETKPGSAEAEQSVQDIISSLMNKQ